MIDLLQIFGNSVQQTGERARSGHQPNHGSKSNTCLVAWLAEGRWWCSSCRRSGDAASFVMQALGIGYSAAAMWLTEHYGPPVDGDSRPAARQGLGRSKQKPYDANVRRVELGGGSDV